VDVGREDASPSGGDENVAALVQKVARVQARQGLRIEELETKLEAGFSDLRSLMAEIDPGAGLRFDDCFDAMDVLDEAARIAPGAEHAHGLRTVLARLSKFLEGAGYRREAAVGQAFDARIFRAVGTEVDDVRQAGTVVRVVRAAILRQGKLIREGEAIVSTRSQ
jgi:hypothetical protein